MKRSIGSRAIGRGLAKVEPESPNTLIAFAAKAGSTASDGDSTNSPFTAALVKFLPRPGLDLRKAFGYARDDVLKATNNRQEPFIYGSLGGDDVALVPATDKATANATKGIDDATLELAFWESIKNDKNPQLFQAYLNRTREGCSRILQKSTCNSRRPRPSIQPASIIRTTRSNSEIPHCFARFVSGSTS